MTVIPEENLLALLETCLALSGRALVEIRASSASQPAPADLVEDYSAFLRELHTYKTDDVALADSSWEWIWTVKPGLTAIQMYGRLSWINYNLFNLL